MTASLSFSSALVLREPGEGAVLIFFYVIPAKAGIQYLKSFLDSRLRGSDGLIVFFSSLLFVSFS
jgi:hypothetical protein